MGTGRHGSTTDPPAMTGRMIMAAGEAQPLASPAASRWVGTRTGRRLGPLRARMVTKASMPKVMRPTNSRELGMFKGLAYGFPSLRICRERIYPVVGWLRWLSRILRAGLQSGGSLCRSYRHARTFRRGVNACGRRYGRRGFARVRRALRPIFHLRRRADRGSWW